MMLFAEDITLQSSSLNGAADSSLGGIYLTAKRSAVEKSFALKINDVKSNVLILSEKVPVTFLSEGIHKISASQVTGQSSHDEVVAMCSSPNDFDSIA